MHAQRGKAAAQSGVLARDGLVIARHIVYGRDVHRLRQQLQRVRHAGTALIDQVARNDDRVRRGGCDQVKQLFLTLPEPCIVQIG